MRVAGVITFIGLLYLHDSVQGQGLLNVVDLVPKVGSESVFDDSTLGEVTIVLLQSARTDEGQEILFETKHKVAAWRETLLLRRSELIFSTQTTVMKGKESFLLKSRGTPRIIFKDPIVPGDGWKGVAENERPYSTVIGKEEIKVPAGIYEAIYSKITYPKFKEFPEWKSTKWYAKGIGEVKWEEGPPSEVNRVRQLLRHSSPMGR